MGGARDVPDSESSEPWPPELLTSKRCCSTADRIVLSKSLVKKKKKKEYRVIQAIKFINGCL